MAVERTLSIIKPDAVAKNVIGKIYQRFEDAGLKIVAAKMAGVDLKALRDVVSGGGANSVMFQRLAAYAIDNDNTQLRFAINNARKDVRYFNHLCEGLGMATPVAQAVHQAYAIAANTGHGENFVPTMVDVIGEWNKKN